MKPVIQILFLTALASPALALDYYHDDFNGTNYTCSSSVSTDQWCMDFPVGRDKFAYVERGGFTYGYGGGDGSAKDNIRFATGNLDSHAISNDTYLYVAGWPNDGDLAYNLWTGRVARFERKYSASESQPFGFQIIRYYGRLGGSSIYSQNTNNIWLIESSTGSISEMLPNAATSGCTSFTQRPDGTDCTFTDSHTHEYSDWQDYDFDTINNFIFLFDKQSNEAMWQYYYGGEQDINLATSTTFDKSTQNLDANGDGVPDKRDDREVGIRMTHDGTTVRIYMNPNPHGRTGTYINVDYTGYSNAWYEVTSRAVPFNTNMKVMVGQEERQFTTDYAEGAYDHYLVRPVADAVTAEMTLPTNNRALASTNNIQFGLKLNPSIRANDAGVGEIYIQKPAGFSGSNWVFNTIEVCLDPSNSNSGKTCNGSGEVKLTAQNADASTALATTNPNTNNVAAFTLEAADNTGNTLVLRLRKTSWGDNQIFRSTTAGANIRVYFTLNTGAANATGEEFTAWVGNEKFANTAQERILDTSDGVYYATTHRMKATPASSEALLVKTYDAPSATMKVTMSPDPLYYGEEDPLATLEIYTSATSNGADITRLIIDLPQEGDTPFEFALNDGTEDIAMVDSLKIDNAVEGITAYQTIADDGNGDPNVLDPSGCTNYFCYYPNETPRRLVVRYGTTYKIPGKSGFERITFFFKKAPLFTANTQITAQWAAHVDSPGFLDDATQQNVAAYNAVAANLQTIVRALPPDAIGWAYPNLVTNNVDSSFPTITNGTDHNSPQGVYRIKNQGGASNIIERVQILIPFEVYNCPSGDPHEGDCAADDTYSGGDADTLRERLNPEPITGATFHNITIDGTAISPTITGPTEESFGGHNWKVMQFDLPAGSYLQQGKTLEIQMDLKYYRSTNDPLHTFPVLFRADNHNYADAGPHFSMGQESPAASWNVSLSPPDPRGEAFVYRSIEANSPAEVYTNEVTQGTTELKMKLVNTGGKSNNINRTVIHYPAFLSITGISTQRYVSGVASGSAYTTATIDDVAKTVTINYAGLGSGAIPSNQDTGSPYEIITFTVSQDASLTNPGGADGKCSVLDTNADGIFETINPSACDGNDGDTTKRSGTFYVKLENASGTLSYAKASTAKTLDMELQFPDPTGVSFFTGPKTATENYDVDATEPSTTAVLYVKNTATLTENNLYKYDVVFPAGMVSAAPTINSIQRDTNGTITSMAGKYTSSWNAGNRTFTIQYSALADSLPKSGAASDGTSVVDVVNFTFTDSVTDFGTQSIVVNLYNEANDLSTGKYAPSTKYYGSGDTDDAYNDTDNQTNQLVYKKPPPEMGATMEPKVVYRTTGTDTVQSKLFLKNAATGGGSNYVTEVKLQVPSGVSVADGAVTVTPAATVTCILNADNSASAFPCTGADGEALRMVWTAPGLAPAATASALISWTHSINTDTTRVWNATFYNGDGNGYGNKEAIPSSLLTTEFLTRPSMKVEVIEKPTDPSNPASRINNQSIRSTVTDYHRFKMTINANSGSAKIHRLKITPPAEFDLSSFQSVDALPAGTTMTVSGSDILVNFSLGKLATSQANLEFRLKETRSFNVPGTHSNAENLTWNVYTDYWSDLFTNATYSHTNLPGPLFTGKLTADSNDDLEHYHSIVDYVTAVAENPVTGTGEAGLAWNILSLANPEALHIMYVYPQSVNKISAGNPDYPWEQVILVENRAEQYNDLRVVEITPPALVKCVAEDNGSSCTATAIPFSRFRLYSIPSANAPESTAGGTLLTRSTDSCATGDYTIVDTGDGGDYDLPHKLRITLCESARLTPVNVGSKKLALHFDAAHDETTLAFHAWTFKAGNFNDTTVVSPDAALLSSSSKTTQTEVVTPTYKSNFVVDNRLIKAESSSNTFTFTVANQSTDADDKITKVRIAFPGYFDLSGLSAANVSSTRGAFELTKSGVYNAASTNADKCDAGTAIHYDTTDISADDLNSNEPDSFNRCNYLQLSYATPIAKDQSDTITVTLPDKFFDAGSVAADLAMANRRDLRENIARSGTPVEISGDSIGNDNGTCEAGEKCLGGKISFKASALYETSGGGYAFIKSFPEESNLIEIAQSDPSAIAYITEPQMVMEDEVDGTTGAPRTHTLRIRVENTASSTTQPGNVIYRLKIKIPDDTMNIQAGVKFDSDNAGWDTPDGLTVTKNATVTQRQNTDGNGGNDGGVYTIDYEAKNGLRPGESDTIQFRIEESSSTSGNIDLVVHADNHSGVLTTAGNENKADENKWVKADAVMTGQGIALNPGLDPSKTLRLTLLNADTDSIGYSQFFVDPDLYDVSSENDIAKLAQYTDSHYVVSLLGNKAQITYLLQNGSQNYKISHAYIYLSEMDVSNHGAGAVHTLWNKILTSADKVTISSSKGGVITLPASISTATEDYSNLSVNLLDLYTQDGSYGADADGADGTHFETLRIPVDYSGLTGGGLAIGEIDKITITFTLPENLDDNLQAEDTQTYTYDAKGEIIGGNTTPATFLNGNYYLKLSSRVKKVGVGGDPKSTIENGNPVYQYFRKPTYGRIIGQIAPKYQDTNAGMKSVLSSLQFTLYQSNGTTRAVDVSNATVPVSVYKKNGEGEYPTYIFDRLADGNYVVKVNSSSSLLESVDYLLKNADVEQKKTWSTFTVTKGVITRPENEVPGPYQVKYKKLDRDAVATQEVYNMSDFKSRLILPPGALDNSPRINIRMEETASQVYGILADIGSQQSDYGSYSVSNRGGHYVFNVITEMEKSGSYTPVVENQLKSDATLILGYSDADISANGWGESSLSIFYWEYTRKKWMKVGGTVNPSDNTVTANITYLHRTYTILSKSADAPIDNVEVFPRVFTPGRTDSYYVNGKDYAEGYKTFANMKLTFDLDASAKKYEVAIYTMDGKRVRYWVKDNTYNQGSVYWDGRDDYGNYVRGGVYMYSIRAGSNRYRGTVVVVR